MDIGFLLILVVSIFLFVIGVIIYFVPAFIAFRRDHPNKIAITLINIFLGATFIFWVVCLVWALTGPPAKIDDSGYPHQ